MSRFRRKEDSGMNEPLLPEDDDGPLSLNQNGKERKSSDAESGGRFYGRRMSVDSDLADKVVGEAKGVSIQQSSSIVSPYYLSPPVIITDYIAAEQRKTKALLSEVYPDEADAQVRDGLEGLIGDMAEARVNLPKEIRAPHVEVRFKNLSWKVSVSAKAGSRGEIKTVASAWAKIICCFRPQKVKEKHILHKVSGILKPGTMTLILGPPGAGKSSLLKALAGRLPKRQLTGSIVFNGHKAKDVVLKSFCGLVGQLDQHIPFLTVRETLDFGLECCNPTAPKSGSESEQKQLNKLRAAKTDFILKVLGLDHVANTFIGNELLRGVSGGQKKRVTIGEMLMNTMSVLLMDEISTGLDSATSFDIIRSLRISCKSQTQTVLMSLLQPSPEVVNLFDDIMIMAKGQIIYHGPKEAVLKYFDNLGFECPFHKDRADFLQEVTTPAGREYIRSDAHDPPRNAEEFATRWKHSEMYKEHADQLLSQYTVRADSGDFNRYLQSAQPKMEFARSFREHQRILTRRQTTMGLRDRFYLRVRLQQMIVVGTLVGTLFYKMSLDQWQLRFSLMFFTGLFISLGNIANMAALMRLRGIFYKQRAANFFRTTNWILAQEIFSFPVALLQAILLSVLVYWLTGLHKDAGEFFVFMITMFAMNLGLAAFARFLGCALKDLDVGQPIAALAVVLFVMFAGFLIAEDDIPSYWIWAFWLSPLSWGVRTLCQNEFHSAAYDTQTPHGNLGDLYLTAYGVRTETWYKWGGVIYLFGFWLFFLLGQVVALHNLRYDGGGSTASVEEEEDDDPLADKKVAIKSSKRNFPFTPMKLVFEDITYTVQVKVGREKTPLVLLRNISGFAKPGRMLALMGETGAGKTTLMDVLAARKTAGKIEGKILINGVETDPTSYARVLGYVEQMDIHLSTQTVREALQFSANLRLPADVPQNQRNDFVEEVLALLELDTLADSLIGSPESGLSTEQRKRVTIGVELAANPALLFLDEPTSGLDSRAAAVVMRVVRNIAQSGRTIICTIHQPSSELFSLFDDLLLLKRGGKIAFFGELGDKCNNLIRYMEGYPDTKKLEPGINPATWMLTVIGVSHDETKEADIDFATLYNNSELRKLNESELAKLKIISAEDRPLTFDSEYASSTTRQMYFLLRRFAIHYWRTPNYNALRIFLLAMLALLFGSVFYQLSETDDQGIRAQISFIYFTTAFCGVLNMAGVLNVVVESRAVFYRERASKTYSVMPFSFGMFVAEAPYLLVTGTIFVSTMYYMVGFKDGADSFLFFWVIFTAYSSMMTFYGQFLAILLPSVQIAQTIGSATVTIWNLFCGFLISRGDIPNFWIWLYWLSPIHYALEATCSDQFYCDYTASNTTGCPKIMVTQGTSTAGNPYTWEYVTDNYGFNYDNRWWDFVAILAFLLFFRVGSALGLRYVKHINR